MKTQPTAKQSRTEGAGTHTPTPLCPHGKLEINCEKCYRDFKAAIIPDGKWLSARIEDALQNSGLDAAFIVRAVNAYEPMREALETLKRSCEEALNGEWDRSDDGFKAMIESIDEALALAEEK